MSVSHRIATHEDLEQIVDIYNSTIASRMVTADTEPASIESRVAWFNEHDPASRPLWVCEDKGRIQAWLSFSSFYGRPAYRKTAEISVYVHAAHRKQGIGSYLVKSAITYAPNIDIDTLLGFIFGHSMRRLALFERLGFSRWGLLPKVALLDGVERDLVHALDVLAVQLGERVDRHTVQCGVSEHARRGATSCPYNAERGQRITPGRSRPLPSTAVMGSLIKKRRKRMRKKKHKKMLKRTRWQRRAAGK